MNRPHTHRAPSGLHRNLHMEKHVTHEHTQEEKARHKWMGPQREDFMLKEQFDISAIPPSLDTHE